MDVNWFIIFEQVLYIAITVVLGFVVKFLKDRGLIEKAKKIQIDSEIKSTGARLAILMAQQVYEKYDGKVKYENAALYLSEYLIQRGIKITDEEIKLLIEGSLLKLKSELKDVWSK